jgi:hypothetical protein
MVANSTEYAMLLEGPVLFLSFASIASAMFALCVAEAVRQLRQEAALCPAVLRMSRTEITPVGRLSGEAAHDEDSPEVKPLPWVHCALLILLASALCYGLGYFVIAELLYGRF